MFPTQESFIKVKDILAICLASLRPLTLEQVFMCVNSLKEGNAEDEKSSMRVNHQSISWDEFLINFDIVSSWLLPGRADKTIMFFHSTVRDWYVYKTKYAGNI